VRAGRRQHNLQIRPLPRVLFRPIILLLAVASIYLLRTLPYFSPDNIFTITQLSLKTPVDTLFKRLASLRPNNTLTETDQLLREKFASSPTSRWDYLHFGPSVYTSCPYCAATTTGADYFSFALPELLAPHLFNLCVIALATSPLFTAYRPAAGYRSSFTLAAMAVALLDVYRVLSYSHATNAAAGGLSEMDFFFWRQRRLRYVLLALLDCALAGVLYPMGTQRFFAASPTPGEMVDTAVQVLVGTKGKVNAAGVMKNTVLRDEELRKRSMAYWAHEVLLMREMMEEREVVESVNDALQNRIDIREIERDAELYANAVLAARGDEGKETVVG